jgi:DNA polymerase (family 10)
MKLRLDRSLTNHEIAEVFEFIAAVLDIRLANKFKIRAYENAADTLRNLDRPIQEYIKENYDLVELPGIGEGICRKLNELYKTGDIKEFERIVASVPAGMYALVPVHGIGPKHAYQLAQKFALNDENTAINRLIKHAKNGEIRVLEGFGEKSEADILNALVKYSRQKKRIELELAEKLAQRVIDVIKGKCSDIDTIETLGSLRRKSKTIGDIDLGIVCADFGCVQEAVKKLDNFYRMLVAGKQMMSFILDEREGEIGALAQVDIKRVTREEWGSFIQHFTGSKEHNIRLREYALKRGMSLSEHGIKDIKTGEIKWFSSEKEFYKKLGIEWMPPEMRVGKDEIREK